MTLPPRWLIPAGLALAGAWSSPCPAQAGDMTVGSPAPPLAITHWLKGEEVTTLEPGRVYLLEFWATW